MKQMKPENEPSGDSFLETMMFDFDAEYFRCAHSLKPTYTPGKKTVANFLKMG